MVLVGSKIQIVDNSGVLFVRCIRLLRGAKRSYGAPGHFIVGTVTSSLSGAVRRVKQKQLYNKGDIVKALVVCSRKSLYYDDLFSIKVDKTSAILVGDNLLPLGSRVSGPVCLPYRRLKQLKLLTLAERLL